MDFNAKNILIDNFLEINNRVGPGAGRKASSTALTFVLQKGLLAVKMRKFLFMMAPRLTWLQTALN